MVGKYSKGISSVNIMYVPYTYLVVILEYKINNIVLRFDKLVKKLQHDARKFYDTIRKYCSSSQENRRKSSFIIT